jgi:predicted CXXCH cytochrome family protein
MGVPAGWRLSTKIKTKKNYMQPKLNIILSFLIIILLGTSKMFAQSNDDCLMCHDDKNLTKIKSGRTLSLYVSPTALGKSVHKSLTCASCHKDAAVAEFPHASTLKPVNCGSCHPAYETQVNSDVHHKLLNLQGDRIPTCKTCHGTHTITTPSNVENKQTEYCGKCHKDNKMSAPYHTFSNTNDNCLSCHNNKNYKSLLAGSVHQKLSCSNCHGYVVNNMDAHQKHSKDLPVADCYLCHNAIAQEHRESIHGISLAEGINEAAQCWNCHGSHDIVNVKDKRSKVYPTNLVNTCGSCHDDPEFAKKYSFAVKQPGKMYSLSVHGKLLSSGGKNAPSCITCHGIHDIKNRIMPGSKISSIDLPNTCASCHKKITEEYERSIHWIGVKKGVREAPTCNDCHSEHSIRAINTVDKREEIKKIQSNTCLQCHQNLLLSERYGMSGGNASSYEDSYHGMAVKRGDARAAMCVDCHGVHMILPKDHDESTISKKNIVATCKKCHPNATEVFASSYSHVTQDKEAHYIESIIGSIYFWLIVIVVGGMFIHNLIIFVHDVRKSFRKIKTEIRIPRFTRNEYFQHIILYVSFILLAITGFQLKFPDSWWSEGLTYLGLDEMVRRYVHRGAALTMISLSLYHMFYLLFTDRGRAQLKGFIPVLGDFSLAYQNIMYNLHLRKKHPEFDYYDYTAKVEYWALIWGTMVMALTGIILWFPTLVGNWAPLWFIKVSEIVHFYEAILATLAIVVWHWFFVIFRPQEYPLNFTTIDGKMTLTHFRDEHRLRLKKIIIEYLEVQAGKRDQKKVSHFTKLFVSSLEKHGIKFSDFVQSELDRDEDLKAQVKEMGL